MSINGDECIILYTCTKSMCNILSICHNSVSSLMLMRQYNNNSVYKHVKAYMIFNVNKYPCKNSPFKYGKISQLITVYIYMYHKHERPWFSPRLLIVTTLITSIKKCQQTDEIYANRYNYEYNNNYLCLYTTCTIKNKCALLRDVCEHEKLLVNMKIQYQFKYRKMFKNIFLVKSLLIYYSRSILKCSHGAFVTFIQENGVPRGRLQLLGFFHYNF